MRLFRINIITLQGLALLLALSFPSPAAAEQISSDTKEKMEKIKDFITDSTRIHYFRLGIVPASNYLHGFQIGPFASFVGQEMRGVNIGANVLTRHNASGFQGGVIFNTVGNEMKGFQSAGVTNIAHTINGCQFALNNYADSVKGVQIGLVNVCRSNTKGMQIGLVNYSHDTYEHKVGLVNVNALTKIDLMAFGGTTNKMNVAMRFRNRSTYNIIGIGTHYMGLDKRFSGALYYRLGQRFPLNDRFAVSGDLGFFHIETFHENSRTTPERLYSLQARMNLEYKLSPMVSIFGSAGWGTTRYYHPSRLYRNRLIGELGLSFRLHDYDDGQQPEFLLDEERADRDTSIFVLPGKKHYVRAGLMAFGLNVFVQRFDRYVINGDYARISMSTINNNFRTGFVWDNDRFSCNLFSHPYHGGLYFNSARSNGLTFWESMPYAFGGSLMWEMTCENEPPAINDLMATTLGGTAIGEVTHRLSALVLNNRERGWSRVWREFLGTAICPMQGLTRMIDGDMWTVNSRKYKYHNYNRIPINLQLTAGGRYLADDNAMFRGESNPVISLSLLYGDPFNDEETQPYDFFTADVTFGLSSNQPLVNGVHLLGRLWSTPIFSDANDDCVFGFFQHFNYYDSEAVKDGTQQVPYRISEAAAVGPGLIWGVSNVASIRRIEQGLYADGILLGGSLCDYFRIKKRDYNMGSGFGLKSKTIVDFGRIGTFLLNAELYKIYTWKGYEGKDLATVDINTLNTQGDIGNAALFVLSSKMQFHLSDALALQLSGSYYWRDSHYKYHENIKTKTYEIGLGLVWTVL